MREGSVNKGIVAARDDRTSNAKIAARDGPLLRVAVFVINVQSRAGLPLQPHWTSSAFATRTIGARIPSACTSPWGEPRAGVRDETDEAAVIDGAEDGAQHAAFRSDLADRDPVAQSGQGGHRLVPVAEGRPKSRRMLQRPRAVSNPRADHPRATLPFRKAPAKWSMKARTTGGKPRRVVKTKWTMPSSVRHCGKTCTKRPLASSPRQV